MSRAVSSWLSGPARRRSEPQHWDAVAVPPACGGEPRRPSGYPGEELGLPDRGSGSLAPMGRRLLALAADWLVAYGLAALGMATGVVTSALLSTAVLVIWLLLGTVAVRLFGFTPGQFGCGLRVTPVDQRSGVGIGRAFVRGLLIALVIPALFVDADGRGLQDRATRTAVVRR